LADNDIVNGVEVATDALETLNGVAQSNPLPKAQRVKILHGADGVGTDTSAASPLPVGDAGVLAELVALAALVDGLETNTAGLATTAKQDAAKTVLDSLLAGLGATGDTSSATTLVGLLKAVKAAVTGTLTIGGAVTISDGSGPVTVDGTIGLAGALPAGTNAIGTVDLAAATPTPITDTAIVTAAKYIGITVCETSGSATAKVRVRNNNVSGVILDTITLAANESVSYTYPRGRAAASGTVYLQVVSGAVEGSVFTA
jgi:hypothetical protein